MGNYQKDLNFLKFFEPKLPTALTLARHTDT